jgi:hypothetical protein
MAQEKGPKLYDARAYITESYMSSPATRAPPDNGDKDIMKVLRRFAKFSAHYRGDMTKSEKTYIQCTVIAYHTFLLKTNGAKAREFLKMTEKAICEAELEKFVTESLVPRQQERGVMYEVTKKEKIPTTLSIFIGLYL